MQIKIDSNFEAVRRQFSSMEKQVRFAAAVALTKTAKDVQAAIPAALDRALDNPTDFTRRGTFVLMSSKNDLAATIGFKDRQAKYMGLQIGGGVRQPGKSGIKLPGEIQLNAFGNIPRGIIAKLKAAAKDGSLGKAVSKRLGADAKDRRKGAAPIQLFYGIPQGPNWKNAPMGIWRRIPPSTPGGKGKLIPVIVFEKTAAVYKAQFDFAGLAKGIAASKFGGHFSESFQRAIATAR